MKIHIIQTYTVLLILSACTAGIRKESSGGEKVNLIDLEPDIARGMKAELTEWLNSIEMSQGGNDY